MEHVFTVVGVVVLIWIACDLVTGYLKVRHRRKD